MCACVMHVCVGQRYLCKGGRFVIFVTFASCVITIYFIISRMNDLYNTKTMSKSKTKKYKNKHLSIKMALSALFQL